VRILQNGGTKAAYLQGSAARLLFIIADLGPALAIADIQQIIRVTSIKQR
jgi:hypothetical protein